MLLVACTHIIFIYIKINHSRGLLFCTIAITQLTLEPCGWGRLYDSHDVDLLFVSLSFCYIFLVGGHGTRGVLLVSTNQVANIKKGPPNK